MDVGEEGEEDEEREGDGEGEEGAGAEEEEAGEAVKEEEWYEDEEMLVGLGKVNMSDQTRHF